MKKKNYILIIFIMCICLIKTQNVYAYDYNRPIQEVIDLFKEKVIFNDDTILNNLDEYFYYYYFLEDGESIGFSQFNWRTERHDKCIYEFVINYDYDHCNQEAQMFWEYMFNKSKYWKIIHIDKAFYSHIYMDLEPYNYVEPTYEIDCNPKEIEVGQTSNCSLKVNYHSKINNLTFKLESEDYTIEDVTSGED